MDISFSFIKLVGPLKARAYMNAIINGTVLLKVKWMQTKKADYGQHTHFYNPPPPLPSLPEIELWKFDQVLNLKSARLFLHFNSNLRDGEQGNQGGIYCVDERSCGRMVLFSLSTSSSWLFPVLHTGLRNMFSTHTYTFRKGGTPSLDSCWIFSPHIFENYNKDDEIVTILDK